MVSDWETFAHKGCKMASQEKGFFSPADVTLLAGFFNIGATIRIG